MLRSRAMRCQAKALATEAREVVVDTSLRGRVGCLERRRGRSGSGDRGERGMAHARRPLRRSLILMRRLAGLLLASGLLATQQACSSSDQLTTPTPTPIPTPTPTPPPAPGCTLLSDAPAAPAAGALRRTRTTRPRAAEGFPGDAGEHGGNDAIAREFLHEQIQKTRVHRVQR